MGIVSPTLLIPVIDCQLFGGGAGRGGGNNGQVVIPTSGSVNLNYV